MNLEFYIEEDLDLRLGNNLDSAMIIDFEVKLNTLDKVEGEYNINYIGDEGFLFSEIFDSDDYLSKKEFEIPQGKYQIKYYKESLNNVVLCSFNDKQISQLSNIEKEILAQIGRDLLGYISYKEMRKQEKSYLN